MPDSKNLHTRKPSSPSTNLPLFDPKPLLEIGDQNFVHQMTDQLVQAMEIRLPLLETAISNQDQSSIQQISHWMKGVLGTCCLYRAAHIAAEINVASNKNYIPKQSNLYNQLITTWSQTRDIIKDYQKTSGS